MPDIEAEHLTARQKKWFASIREGLQRETGKSLAEWIEIARTCPETRPRARLKWFKDTHGLLQNRASYVLGEAYPSGAGAEEPKMLRDALWPDPAQRTILEAVETAVLKLPKFVAGQRKGYSAWSNAYQFAALRPIKGGGAVLGLALSPEAAPQLEAPDNEGWSERLKARMKLTSADDVTGEVGELLRRAWELS
jgi:hypothetical protein